MSLSIEKLKKKSRDKKLCVAVSCKGNLKLLNLHLRALKRQSLSPELWIPVFLFWGKTPRESYQKALALIQKYFPSAPVLLLSKESACCNLRNLAFESLSPLLYFLDEDVLLKRSEHLTRLLDWHERHPDWTAIGGSYISSKASSFWGEIYNWLVRFWMTYHQSFQKRDFLPAGNLSVKRKGLSDRFYSPAGFGGEEIFFLKSLHKKGLFSVWIRELDAHHIAQHRLKDWISRAWMHGKSLSASQKLFSRAMAGKFFKQSGSFQIKLCALFYLLLTRLSCILTAKKANRA